MRRAPRPAFAGLLLLAALAAGCSYTFDPAVAVPVVGAEPVLADRPLVTRGQVLGGLSASDGTPWLLTGDSNGAGNGLRSIALSRLVGAPARDELQAVRWLRGRGVLYLVEAAQNRRSTPTLVIHRPGDPASDRVVALASTSDFLAADPAPGGDGEAILVRRRGSGFAELLDGDGEVRTRIPLSGRLGTLTVGSPLQVDFAHRTLVYVDGRPCPRGGTFTQCTTVYAQSFDAAAAITLGVFAFASARLHPTDPALILCSDRGLLVQPYDGTAATVIDPICEGFYGPNPVNGQVVYAVASGSAEVLDGWTPGSAAPPRARYRQRDHYHLLAIGPDTVAESTSGYAEASSGAYDGWIGDWPFMERGSSVGFASGSDRVRWLEHTATVNGAGQLLSQSVRGDHGQVLTLARNCARFAEAPDGRVLAAADQTYLGAHNRVLVIDEASGTARVVAESAPYFALVDGLPGVLVTRLGERGVLQLQLAPLPPATP